MFIEISNIDEDSPFFQNINNIDYFFRDGEYTKMGLIRSSGVILRIKETPEEIMHKIDQELSRRHETPGNREDI